MKRCLGIYQGGLRPRQLRFGLCELRGEGSRVDEEEKLSFPDVLTVPGNSPIPAVRRRGGAPPRTPLPRSGRVIVPIDHLPLYGMGNRHRGERRLRYGNCLMTSCQYGEHCAEADGCGFP